MNDQPLAGQTVYDAIVVGAGHAGVTAARDLADRGLSVLVLEANDRIGAMPPTRAVGGPRTCSRRAHIHWRGGDTGRVIELWVPGLTVRTTVDRRLGDTR